MPTFDSVLVAFNMHKQMAAYLEQRHANNYILYNLTVQQDLSMFE